MLRFFGPCLLALALSSTARADTDDPKALFERATVEFRLGRFHDAARTYERVYELHHDPVILYNCAQSYRLANEPEKALIFYKSYLSSTDATNREEVEGRIAELERVIAEQKKANERPPNEVVVPKPPPTEGKALPPPTSQSGAAPTEDHGRTKTIAGIALLGTAVAAAVGGIVAAVFSGKASDSINSAAKANQPFDPQQEKNGSTDTIVSGVMFGVAGAAAIAGGVLLTLGVRERHARESRVSLLPAISSTSVGGVAAIRF